MGLLTGRSTVQGLDWDAGELLLGSGSEIPWFDFAHHKPLRFAPVGMTGVRCVGMRGVAVSSILSGARLGRPSWHRVLPGVTGVVEVLGEGRLTGGDAML